MDFDIWQLSTYAATTNSADCLKHWMSLLKRIISWIIERNKYNGMSLLKRFIRWGEGTKENTKMNVIDWPWKCFRFDDLKTFLLLWFASDFAPQLGSLQDDCWKYYTQCITHLQRKSAFQVKDLTFKIKF